MRLGIIKRCNNTIKISARRLTRRFEQGKDGFTTAKNDGLSTSMSLSTERTNVIIVLDGSLAHSSCLFMDSLINVQKTLHVVCRRLVVGREDTRSCRRVDAGWGGRPSEGGQIDT